MGLSLSLRNVVETLAISAPTVFDAGVGRVTKERCDARLDAWSRAVVSHARIRLEVAGREHLVPGETYVVMSNHQSLYDIPVLFRVFGPNIRMIAKSELFRIPVFGHAMSAAGFISVDRAGGRAAVRSLGVARDLLGQRTHVWIAPEGTRSRDGSLLAFKPGAFLLADRARHPRGHSRCARSRGRPLERGRERPCHRSRADPGARAARRKGRPTRPDAPRAKRGRERLAEPRADSAN